MPEPDVLVDLERWSGDGDFTRVMLDRLRLEPRIAFVRVEDAPASRSEVDYSFVSNELYVRFATERRRQMARLLGIIPVSRPVVVPAMTLAELGAVLEVDPAVGPIDYADAGMLQFLRTQRIIPPYQTRGYKLVELVRVYAIQEPDLP